MTPCFEFIPLLIPMDNFGLHIPSEIRIPEVHYHLITDEAEKLKREVLRLISLSEVGKAVSLMNSHGVASMSDPEVLRQLEAKYPAREHELPARVVKGEAVSNMRGLREGLKNLRKRRSPGAGGLRPEFLRVVVTIWRDLLS